jgi:V8-like Glu-specific endopeptidase
MISNDLFLTAGHCFDQTGGGWERPRINNTKQHHPVDRDRDADARELQLSG